MRGWGDEEESPRPRRTYSPAEAAADLAFYRRLRRTACLGTFLAVTLGALALRFWDAWFAVALTTGGIAGVANALLSMYGNERLLDRRSVVTFVISSFVRIGLFGIVPVVLAVQKPSVWTLGWYFFGFFMPLVLSGILAVLRERDSG